MILADKAAKLMRIEESYLEKGQKSGGVSLDG